MTWEEFRRQLKTPEDYKDTDLKCPNCGAKIKIYKQMVVTPYSTMYHYCCFDCGWYEWHDTWSCPEQEWNE